MPKVLASYTVSPALLARDEMRAALRARDFRAAFLLMKKFDGASQDRIASPVEGLTQGRVSRIATGQDHIASLVLIERVADALRIPGAYLGLAPRPWEAPGAPGPAAVDTLAPGYGLVVEHDDAELTFDGHHYLARQRRLLRNDGAQPVTRYLVRISVDRYPGDTDLSNQLYRAHPLTWDELALTAHRGDEAMSWQVKNDRDAVKEVWLLFENAHGHFPLYPGESAWIDYSYRVGEQKWGNWFQRSVRVPTRSLSVRLVFPAALEPVVWGMETSMTAEAFPLRTAIRRADEVGADGQPLRTFSWSTEEPPLHTRYRVEWQFRGSRAGPPDGSDPHLLPSARMAVLGVVQAGPADPAGGGPGAPGGATAAPSDPAGPGGATAAPADPAGPGGTTAGPAGRTPARRDAGEPVPPTVLRRPARPFDLPAEAEDARRVVATLHAAAERVSAVHTFGKGLGIAAPQLGIGRSVALVRTASGGTFTLLNPRVVEEGDHTDEQYEGCLSFFDVRGLVPRPLVLHVEHADLDGQRRITIFERGDARLVAHEIDHLEGRLYTERMRPGVRPIPVDEYRGGGSDWTYPEARSG